MCFCSLIVSYSWERTHPHTRYFACPYAKINPKSLNFAKFCKLAKVLDLLERYYCSQDVQIATWGPLSVLEILIFWRSTFVLATWNLSLRVHCKVVSLILLFFLLGLLISFWKLVLCALNQLFSCWMTRVSTWYSLISFFNCLFFFFNFLSKSSLSEISVSLS